MSVYRAARKVIAKAIEDERVDPLYDGIHIQDAFRLAKAIDDIEPGNESSLPRLSNELRSVVYELGLKASPGRGEDEFQKLLSELAAPPSSHAEELEKGD